MYREYNRLKDYIHKASDLLQKDMLELITKLKKSSFFLEEINNYSYDKMIGYYNILTQLIDSKYKMISGEDNEEDEDELDNTLEDIGDSDMKKFGRKYKDCLKYNYKIFLETFDITEKFKLETEGILKDLFTKDKKKRRNEEKKEGEEEEEEEDDSMSSEISFVLDKNGFKSLSHKFAKSVTLFSAEVPIPPFVLIFPAFPILQMKIVPKISFELGYEIGREINVLKKELSVFFDISANAEVSVSLEVGCYIPPFPVGMEIALSVGIKGLLGSGEIGMKLCLFIN